MAIPVEAQERIHDVVLALIAGGALIVAAWFAARKR